MALFIIELDDIASAPRTLSLVEFDDIGSAPRTISIKDIEQIGEQFNPHEKGRGMLAGLAPAAPAKLPGGAPAPNITIELYLKGVKVQTTTTSLDGSWAFYGLQQNQLYDVVARHPSLESVISTKRIAGPMPVEIFLTPIFSDATHARFNIIFQGGFGFYTVQEMSSSPLVQIEQKDNTATIVIEKDSVAVDYIIRVTAEEGGFDEVTVSIPSL